MGSTADKAKGKIKETAGKATGNEDLEREGKVDRATGNVKEKAGQAADKVREGADKLMDKVRGDKR